MLVLEQETSPEQVDLLEKSPRSSIVRTRRRKLIYGSIAILTVLALSLGVGLGLGLHRQHNQDGAAGNDQLVTSNNWTVINRTVSASTWQPKPGTTFNYQLRDPVDISSVAYRQGESMHFDVWTLDLFDNTANAFHALQSAGSRVICYFSAGSYEPNRPDSSKFSKSDLGGEVKGWNGEYWLRLSSQSVRDIMLARLDLAAAKGCDGVDPDNMDGYSNKENAIGLTGQDTVDFMSFLADAAQARNLSIGLKNADAVIPNLIEVMQWSVNEQCSLIDECQLYAPFIAANKPVFNVEYPKGTEVNDDSNVTQAQFDKACHDPKATGFSKIIKNMNLDTWIERCS